jgi:hypothetical protein
MTFAMSRAGRGQFLADHAGEAGLVGGPAAIRLAAWASLR